MSTFPNMFVLPGDTRMVGVHGTVKPINCGNAKIAKLLAAAPDLYETISNQVNYLQEELDGHGVLAPRDHYLLEVFTAALAKVQS